MDCFSDRQIGEVRMKTIQLALQNREYARLLENLLQRDGAHQVYVVDQPDLKLDGVIVIDGKHIDNLSMLDPEPERFVVITSKGSDRLARIWDAGVRHVVFEGDSPSTAHLAIIAAEMRCPTQAPRPARSSAGAMSRKAHHLASRGYLATPGEPCKPS